MSPPDRPDRFRAVTLVLAVGLLAWVTTAGAVGSEPPERLVSRLAEAFDTGDAGDVAALLADDPTIVSWMPALPRGRNSASMTLLDLGRADQVKTGRPAPLADFIGYYQGLATATDLVGCEEERPRRGSQRLLYDVWVVCAFSSTNELLDEVAGEGAFVRGEVRFGIERDRVRAVLVNAKPNPAHDPVWDFIQWVWQQDPDQFPAWLRGRIEPVISADSAAALRQLADRYADRAA